MFATFVAIYSQRNVYLQNRLDYSFFKISWYSNLFADFITWKEKQWTPAHATRERIHIGKKEKTFLPKTNFVFACLCKLFPHSLPFSLCIPARLAIISRVTWTRCKFVVRNVARLSKFIPHFVVQHQRNLSLHNKTHLLVFVQQLVLLLFSDPMRDLLFLH